MLGARHLRHGVGTRVWSRRARGALGIAGKCHSPSKAVLSFPFSQTGHRQGSPMEEFTSLFQEGLGLLPLPSSRLVVVCLNLRLPELGRCFWLGHSWSRSLTLGAPAAQAPFRGRKRPRPANRSLCGLRPAWQGIGREPAAASADGPLPSGASGLPGGLSEPTVIAARGLEVEARDSVSWLDALLFFLRTW